jgi:hypothetical protein
MVELTLDQVRKAQRPAVWRDGAAGWLPPDKIVLTGKLTIGPHDPAGEPFATGWRHAADCDCQFCHDD